MTAPLFALALLSESRAGEVPYTLQAPIEYRCKDVTTHTLVGSGEALLTLDAIWDTETPPTRTNAPFQGIYWFDTMDLRIFGVTGPFGGEMFSAAGGFRADVYDGYPNIGDGVSFFSNARVATSDNGERFEFLLLLGTPDDVFRDGLAMPVDVPSQVTTLSEYATGLWFADPTTRCTFRIPEARAEVSCTFDGDRDGVCDHNEDEDGDGHGPATDCDDSDPARYEGAEDVPDDGIDQNCDGGDMCFGDGDVDGARTETLLWSLDTDCDDPGEAHFQAPLDCDDDDFSRYPGATEIVGDGVDQDCDGLEVCYLDGDGDGARSETTQTGTTPDCSGQGEIGPDSAVDCDDQDADRYPGATEIPNDGIDQDCSGDDLVASTWADVSQIFAMNCTPCHTGPSPLGSGGLVFQGPADLVGVSSGPSTPPYVVAGDPAGSFLYQKITNTQGAGNGSRMPFGFPALGAAQIDAIELWIADGALE